MVRTDGHTLSEKRNYQELWSEVLSVRPLHTVPYRQVRYSPLAESKWKPERKGTLDEVRTGRAPRQRAEEKSGKWIWASRSRVDKRLLVLQPGIRAVPLRWETQLQDTGPQETFQLHVIPNGENLSEISISTSRPSFTQRPASYSAGHPMPNN